MAAPMRAVTSISIFMRGSSRPATIIIAAGRTDLRDAPQLVLAPSMVIFGVVLSLNYLGDVVRVRLDVRESAL